METDQTEHICMYVHNLEFFMIFALLHIHCNVSVSDLDPNDMFLPVLSKLFLSKQIIFSRNAEA